MKASCNKVYLENINDFQIGIRFLLFNNKRPKGPQIDSLINVLTYTSLTFHLICETMSQFENNDSQEIVINNDVLSLDSSFDYHCYQSFVCHM